MAESGRRRETGRQATARARRAAMKKKSRRKRRIQVWIRRGIALLVLVLIILLVAFGVRGLFRLFGGGSQTSLYGLPDYITEAYLTVNPYSRPGVKLPDGVKGIVVHYVSNPGSTAENNRNYFEGLKDSGDTYASSNFIIGLDGEILATVPIDEVAYASNSANEYTLSIECCHPDETGEFNEKTYDSLVRLTAYLCNRFNLDSQDVIRHYDVTGKECPLYFVEHEDAWEAFRQDVQAATDQLRAESAGTATDGGSETAADSGVETGDGDASGEASAGEETE